MIILTITTIFRDILQNFKIFIDFNFGRIFSTFIKNVWKVFYLAFHLGLESSFYPNLSLWEIHGSMLYLNGYDVH